MHEILLVKKSKKIQNKTENKQDTSKQFGNVKNWEKKLTIILLSGGKRKVSLDPFHDNVIFLKVLIGVLRVWVPSWFVFWGHNKDNVLA